MNQRTDTTLIGANDGGLRQRDHPVRGGGRTLWLRRTTQEESHGDEKKRKNPHERSPRLPGLAARRTNANRLTIEYSRQGMVEVIYLGRLGRLDVAQRIGQDVEEARALGNNFKKQSELIATARREIASGVEKAWWIGPAADRFRAAWTDEYAPALQRIQQGLEEAGRSVKAHSDAIEKAGR